MRESVKHDRAAKDREVGFKKSVFIIDNSDHSSASKLRKVNNYQLHFRGVHRVLRALLLTEAAEVVDVDVELEELEVFAVLILNRNQPVASHISRHTVELYQNRSKVTNNCGKKNEF